LRVAAEHVAGHPAEDLAVLAAELHDHRLEVLEAGGDPRAGVRAAFSWSARRLPPEASRVFRLAARFPVLDAKTVAAMLGDGVCAARRVLELLATEHLVRPGADGRYVLSGLLRAYAASLDEQLRPAAHHPPTRLPQGEAPGADAGSPHPRRNHDRDSRPIPA